MGSTLMLWQMAARNILQARRRSLLLSAALGTVAMFMVLLMTLSQGLSDTLIHSATVLFTGHVNISGIYKTRPNNAAMALTASGADTVRHIASQLPGVERLVDRARGWGKLTSADTSLEAVITGVDIDAEPALANFMQIAEERDYVPGGTGETYGDVKGLARPQSVVLFAGQAKRLGVRVGDALTVSAETLSGLQNSDELEVVAIIRDGGYLTNRHVFVHKQTVRSLYQLNDQSTSVVMLYLNDLTEAPRAMQALHVALQQGGVDVLPYGAGALVHKMQAVRNEDWTGQRVDLTAWNDELGDCIWILQTLNALTILFVTILVLIVVAGIINTLWIAVRERTQEIGMLRAIGMSRRRVLGLFMSEATLLGFGATTTGSVVGALLAWLVNRAEIHIPIDAIQTVLMSDVLALSPRPAHVLYTVLLFSVFTGMAALWPALQATRVQPLTAIQKVG